MREQLEFQVDLEDLEELDNVHQKLHYLWYNNKHKVFHIGRQGSRGGEATERGNEGTWW